MEYNTSASSDGIAVGTEGIKPRSSRRSERTRPDGDHHERRQEVPEEENRKKAPQMENSRAALTDGSFREVRRFFRRKGAITSRAV